MKTRSSFFSKAILCVLMAALTLVICFPVAAATNSTTLTTTVPGTVLLLLELTGNGTVTVDGVAYTQSGTIEISQKSDVVLCITPAEGNYIESVTCNSGDLTDAVKDGSLMLPDISGETRLHIAFAEIESAPTTGDLHYYLLPCLIAFAVISLVNVVAVLCFKKKYGLMM